MFVCAAGDTHGALDRFCGDLAAFEAHLGRAFDHGLHVGDFGVWPDPSRLDRATREHDGPGDFAVWLKQARAMPRPTTFIQGNHEDFDWLFSQQNREVLPGLTFLPNGHVTSIRTKTDAIRVAGLGGCWSPTDYDKPGRKQTGKARAHYTRDQIEALRGDVDVLLLHDAPAGTVFAKQHRDGRTTNYVSEAQGLADVISRLRPRIVFFGHHHARVRTQVADVPVIGLNLVGQPGHLVAVEFDKNACTLVTEWPDPQLGIGIQEDFVKGIRR